MPEWIHNRAEHLLAKNPSMSKSTAFAVATQQSHSTGHSPKGYGTKQGRRTAKRKYDTPKGDVQTANPGKLDSPKMAGKPKEASAFFDEFNAIMKEAKELIPGGKAEGKTDADYPSDQIAMGEKVELEHTPDPAVAREISRDHLEEFKDYYTRLKKMEEQAKSDEVKKEGAAGELGGLIAGLPAGRNIAGEVAAATAPEGRVTRSENIARQAGWVGAPAGGLGALALAHKYDASGRLARSLPPGGLIADPATERAIIEFGVPAAAALGGSMAGGALTGLGVGGVQQLRGSPKGYGTNKKSEKEPDKEASAFADELLKIALEAPVAPAAAPQAPSSGLGASGVVGALGAGLGLGAGLMALRRGKVPKGHVVPPVPRMAPVSEAALRATESKQVQKAMSGLSPQELEMLGKSKMVQAGVPVENAYQMAQASLKPGQSMSDFLAKNASVTGFGSEFLIRLAFMAGGDVEGGEDTLVAQVGKPKNRMAKPAMAKPPEKFKVKQAQIPTSPTPLGTTGMDAQKKLLKSQKIGTPDDPNMGIKPLNAIKPPKPITIETTSPKVASVARSFFAKLAFSQSQFSGGLSEGRPFRMTSMVQPVGSDVGPAYVMDPKLSGSQPAKMKEKRAFGESGFGPSSITGYGTRGNAGFHASNPQPVGSGVESSYVMDPKLSGSRPMKLKKGAMTKEGGEATTPQGKLVQAQNTGQPKKTGFSGPSIAEVSKPVGFGIPLPGAKKNRI